MTPFEDAVETLRPGASFSDSRPTSAKSSSRNSKVDSLSDHPYSSPTTHQRSDSSASKDSGASRSTRAERLLNELEAVNVSSSAQTSLPPPQSPLPSPPPSAFLSRQPAESPARSPAHPLAILPTIIDVSPSTSPTDPRGSAQIDSSSGRAAAWTLSLRTSQHPNEHDIEAISVSHSIVDAPQARPSLEPPLPEFPTRPGSPSNFSFDEDTKAREYEKRLGRKKLMWWLLFWLVVIGGTAIGIGIAASVKAKSSSSKKNDSEVNAIGSTSTEARGSFMTVLGVSVEAAKGEDAQALHDLEPESTPLEEPSTFFTSPPGTAATGSRTYFKETSSDSPTERLSFASRIKSRAKSSFRPSVESTSPPKSGSEGTANRPSHKIRSQSRSRRRSRMTRA
ncbi:hypothetical protein JCM16303_006981 [Sporobolomyces ruberrimus]